MSVGLDVVALARQLRDLNFDESTIVQICKQESERDERERKEKEERERKKELNEVVGASIPDLSPSLTRCATMQLSGMKDGAMALLTCRCRRACQCTFLENHFEVPRGHNLLDRLASMSTDAFSLLCYRYQHHQVTSDFLQTYLCITGKASLGLESRQTAPPARLCPLDALIDHCQCFLFLILIFFRAHLGSKGVSK